MTAEEILALLELHTAEQPTSVDGTLEFWTAKRETWGLDEAEVMKFAATFVIRWLLPELVKHQTTLVESLVGSFLAGLDSGFMVAMELESRRIAEAA